MKVRLTRPAREDILNIIQKLAVTDQDHSIATAEQLSRAILATSTMSRRFPVIGWTGGTGIRKQMARPYVILFDSRDREGLILRIVHERSDWMSLV